MPAGEGAGLGTGGLGSTYLVGIGAGGLGVLVGVGICVSVLGDESAATGKTASAVATPSFVDPHETTQTINTHINNDWVKRLKRASGGRLRVVNPDPHCRWVAVRPGVVGNGGDLGSVEVGCGPSKNGHPAKQVSLLDRSEMRKVGRWLIKSFRLSTSLERSDSCAGSDANGPDGIVRVVDSFKTVQQGATHHGQLALKVSRAWIGLHRDDGHGEIEGDDVAVRPRAVDTVIGAAFDRSVDGSAVDRDRGVLTPARNAQMQIKVGGLFKSEGYSYLAIPGITRFLGQNDRLTGCKMPVHAAVVVEMHPEPVVGRAEKV